MQIHDLNTGTPASDHYIAMDTGSDTYKATPGNVVPSYTSGDSSSASSWTSVTAVGTGLSFSTLINRITTMMKNVRYLYALLGTTSISGIGNGTVTGALSTLNSNLTWSAVTLTAGSGITINTQQAFTYGKILFVYMRWTASSSVSAYATIATHGKSAKVSWNAPLMNDANTIVSSLGLYADQGNTTIRAAGTISAGTYRTFINIPIQ